MKKVLRLMIMIISLGAVYLLYTHFYAIESLDDVDQAIEAKIGQAVEIIEDKYIEDEWLVYFQTSTEHGYFYLSKGLNDMYRLGSGHMEKNKGLISFADYLIDDKAYLVIMGDPQAFDEFLAEKQYFRIGYDHVFLVVDTVIKSSAVEGYKYRIGSQIEEITFEEDNIYEIKSGEINNGPRQIVWATCILILIVGYATSCMFTPKTNRLEKLYFKLTKSGPSDEEPADKNDYMMLQ